MNKNYAIILAGGHGLRVGDNIPKQFLPINNKPIIIWSLETFNKMPEINGIIIALPVANLKLFDEILSNYNIPKIIKIVPGGLTRHLSSYNTVKCMNFNSDDILIFHDAARPFISEDLIRNCIDAAIKFGAAGTYVKTIDTIAEVKERFIHKIPDRDILYNTQTPQSFKYSIIKRAHFLAQLNSIETASDDVQLVLNTGFNVRIIEGDYRNIKITTKYDLEMAEFIAGKMESKKNK
jgi:D-ribitol-5-phosphate cytidylyltransferase